MENDGINRNKSKKVSNKRKMSADHKFRITSAIPILVAIIAGIFGLIIALRQSGYFDDQLDVKIVIEDTNRKALEGLLISIAGTSASRDPVLKNTDNKGSATFEDVEKGAYIYTFIFKDSIYKYTLDVSGKNEIIDTQVIRLKTAPTTIISDTIATYIPEQKKESLIDTSGAEKEKALVLSNPKSKLGGSKNNSKVRSTVSNATRKPTTNSMDKASNPGDFWTELKATASTNVNSPIQVSNAWLDLFMTKSAYPYPDYPKISHIYNPFLYTEYTSGEGGVIFWTNCKDCEWTVKVGRYKSKFYGFYAYPPKTITRDLVFLSRSIYEPFEFSIIDRTGMDHGMFKINVLNNTTLVVKIEK